MTNNQIIKEVEGKNGGATLHTFSGWLKVGRRVLPGSKGIPTRLWKQRKTEEGESYYLTKAYLYSRAQTEDVT